MRRRTTHRDQGSVVSHSGANPCGSTIRLSGRANVCIHVGGAGQEVEGGLRAPMLGNAIALSVEPGTQVEKGAPLLVLKAMKMEHAIVAPRKGVINAHRFAPGDQVTDGAELVDFDGAE